MSFELNRFANNDPFGGEDNDNLISEGPIHIRIQQRNGRKTLTTVQGLSDKFNKKMILKALKKNFSCNGTIISHQEYGEVIQLQGDQRNNVVKFFEETKIASGESVKVHGF